MIFVTDVHYGADDARAAVVGLRAWTDTGGVVERTRESSGIAPYVAGRFFERELPCILPLLRPLVAQHPDSVVVVDGYVDLDEAPGLGRHLADRLDAMGHAAHVVGVAKNEFPGARAVAVQRGGGTTPLWVGASSMTLDAAAAAVRSMAGPHRLPDMCVRADHLARGLARPGSQT